MNLTIFPENNRPSKIPTDHQLLYTGFTKISAFMIKNLFSIEPWTMYILKENNDHIILALFSNDLHRKC